MSQKRAITTFLSRKSMIMRLLIAIEDILGSSIAPQVMPPWSEEKGKPGSLIFSTFKAFYCIVLYQRLKTLKRERTTWVSLIFHLHCISLYYCALSKTENIEKRKDNLGHSYIPLVSLAEICSSCLCVDSQTCRPSSWDLK